ncbi:hypothetical protein ACFY12_04570 [Streptomyces sp. NPDC001339]|uniref:hypothetical protein n=1 Tax=Streptomyces sp. NPDC001339 TaxID=3364563 RepID=UPI00368E2D7C
MTDRRRRAALLLPLPATSPGAVLLRDRKSPSSSSGPSSAPTGPSSPPAGSPSSASGPSSSASGPSSSSAPGSDQDTPDKDTPDNPFAPPPADAPDQEWRPRYPASHAHGQGRDGNGNGNGDSDSEHPAQDGRSAPAAWGSQWSPRQPGRQSGGGFGTRPGGRNGQQSGPGGPGNLRWDPTDPLQRRARYALLAGMWAFFFVLLFGLPEVSLLLGALAIYWGISSLRGKPDATKSAAAAAATTAAMEGRPPLTDTTPTPGLPPGTPQSPARPQATAAIAGLVTASLALMLVAATFTVQIAYRDYFTCVNDALTRSASKSCENLLPKQLRPLLSTATER